MPLNLLDRKLKIGYWHLPLFFYFICCSVSFAVEPRDFPKIQLQIQFLNDSLDPKTLRGSINISNLTEKYAKQICFYLPYQDPEYGSDRGDMHRFQMITSAHRKPIFSEGSTSVSEIKNIKSIFSPWRHIIKLEIPDGWTNGDSVHMEFTSQIPRLERSRKNEWFYEGFFPQLMQRCPDDAESNPDVSLNNAADYEVSIRIPEDWTYVGMGSIEDQFVTFNGMMSHPSFMLVQGFKQQKFKFSNIPVNIAFQSEAFLELVPTIEIALATMTDILGPYPYQSLTLIESSELQRHSIPGIISVNRPPQLIFDKVQKDLLNWQHWITVIQLSKQWLGSLVFTRSSDDNWILSGISEYATIETLKKNQNRYDLFNNKFWEEKIFTFNYLQQSEILTSLLKKNSPYSVLTRTDDATLLPHLEQNKLLFLRHTSALRQVQTIVGKERLQSYLQKFLADFAFKSISPQDFITHLEKLPSPFSEIQRQEIKAYFKNWWTLEGWPDFKIRDIFIKNLPQGQYSIEIQVDQEGSIDHPPIVAIMAQNGKILRQLAKKELQNAWWTARFIINHPIDWIEIDPEHDYFDGDRFNNSTRPPKFYFFPGTANTIADNAYTLVWIPYPFRRPGEDLSIGIQGGIFKYVHGAITTHAEYSPAHKKNAYFLNYNYQWDHKSFTNGFVIQKRQDNSREVELNFTDQNLIKSSYAFSSRHNQKKGSGRARKLYPWLLWS